jgi:23S rRNA (guanosine2251-2'-O)-methyltransferase
MDLKKVEEIYKFLRQWEVNFTAGISDDDIKKLKSDLQSLSSNSQIEIQKLSGLVPHFHANMTSRELFNLLIPFERALQKSLRDDEFLVSDKDQDKYPTQKYPLYIILENLRSAFNVGAFFRMAEALGAEEIILAGYTATPENEKIKKTTMGTDSWQRWRQASSLADAVQELKAKGVRIVAVETSEKAIPVEKPFQVKPTAFIFGNERFGLGLETLQMADEIRQVSLIGQKNSLNVATCGAICCHEWIRQWKKNTQ